MSDENGRTLNFEHRDPHFMGSLLLAPYQSPKTCSNVVKGVGDEVEEMTIMYCTSRVLKTLKFGFRM
jgi:hypothetical protein